MIAVVRVSIRIALGLLHLNIFLVGLVVVLLVVEGYSGGGIVLVVVFR